MHRPTRSRQVLLLALCALVFWFALHAKTGVYGDGIPVKVTPSTAGKLWLSGQKMEIQPVTSSPSALLFCIALLLIYRLYLHRKPRVPTAFCLPAARHLVCGIRIDSSGLRRRGPNISFVIFVLVRS